MLYQILRNSSTNLGSQILLNKNLVRFNYVNIFNMYKSLKLVKVR